MNSQMLGNLPPNTVTALTSLGDISGWRFFTKMTDLVALRPTDAWIFADETMYSMNDGYLQMALNSPKFLDYPANYHGGGNCFSFADGHAESHKWKGVLVGIPYAKGVTHTSNGDPSVSGSDPDWLWLKAHTSIR